MFTDMAEKEGLSEDELAEKIFHNRTFKVKVNGKAREMDYSDIKNHLSRETTFQKKHDLLAKSDEMKNGLLLKAAQEGDKGAMKRLQSILTKAAGAEDADDMNDRLEEVEDKFDENAALVARSKDAAFEAEFADVKEDVDYEKHMGTIQTSLKESMPVKVWERYWNSATDRKAMYTLAASGRLESLMDAFQSEVDKLPLEKQLELEGDPDLYGRAFLSVIKKDNAKTAPQEESQPPEADGLSAVSSGTKSTKRSQTSETPDFSTMTSEEFVAFKRKNGLAT